ncbi:transglycosylase domain-containing protein [Anaerobranca gottschalkii]|uniref:Penicillin-binding protein 1A n=1 Tax=Anaerobranca gottschalkii DSM 13577 TaxID=1120990 RepID=A0A1H9ZTI5_9FIRM|nr:transglycosylase domain-containing protein [Anaerobranca gottschalkii]SES85079.1 Membrane carboxypeptidase (penicillin-binding protein) [Anaerobranca gottschalkii DSM 13577]
MVNESRKERSMKKKLRFYYLKIFITGFLAVFLIASLTFSGYLLYLAYIINDVQLESNIYPTTIFDNKGEPIGTVEASSKIYVPLKDISPYFINAVIAVEDNVFYSHIGVNPLGILRALYTNIRERRITQGGSTITQQLAKNIFLTSERTLDRKLRELVYTLKLELNYSKDEILEAYLNNIYYGHGNYGIGAASEFYFNKHPRELTLEEAALLAGIIQGPYLYTPLRPANLEPQPNTGQSRTYTRRAFVLTRMVQQGYISEEEGERAKEQPITVVTREERLEQPQIPLFVLTELDRLEKELGFVNGQLRSGYNIFTTINYQAQIVAQQVIGNFRDILPQDKKEDENISAALVALDPKTGGILAMAGGINAFQGIPQPGSAMKPLVYAYGLESQVYTLTTEHFCGETLGRIPQAPGYDVSDYGSRYHNRYLTMREAIIDSCNVYAVLTNSHLGPENTQKFAYHLGYKGPLQPVPAMVLGPNGVNLNNMASVYAVFANGGYLREPYIIEEIHDRFGNIIYRRPPQIPTKVLSEETAFLITDALRDVLRRGTASSVSNLIPSRDAAVKTGTTEHYAFIAGYTPEMVTTTYIGFNNPTGKLELLGGRDAGRLWATFTNTALNRMFGENIGGVFSPPPGIVQKNICRETLLLASPQCPLTFTEYFIIGTEPKSSCNLHQNNVTELNVCLQSWGIATEYCPSTLVRRFRFSPGQWVPNFQCPIHTGQ